MHEASDIVRQRSVQYSRRKLNYYAQSKILVIASTNYNNCEDHIKTPFIDSDDLKAMHTKGVSETLAFMDQHNQAKNWPSKADTQELSLVLWTLGGCLSMGGMEGQHQ